MSIFFFLFSIYIHNTFFFVLPVLLIYIISLFSILLLKILLLLLNKYIKIFKRYVNTNANIQPDIRVIVMNTEHKWTDKHNTKLHTTYITLTNQIDPYCLHLCYSVWISQSSCYKNPVVSIRFSLLGTYRSSLYIVSCVSRLLLPVTFEKNIDQ